MEGLPEKRETPPVEADGISHYSVRGGRGGTGNSAQGVLLVARTFLSVMCAPSGGIPAPPRPHIILERGDRQECLCHDFAIPRWRFPGTCFGPHAIISFATLPATSVRRKSRPA